MTGPEHYRKAEHLLAGTDIPADAEQGYSARHERPSRMDLMEAQTHLLAALVALAADHTQPESIAWQEAIHQ